MDPVFSAGKISYCQGCPESKAPVVGRIGVTIRNDTREYPTEQYCWRCVLRMLWVLLKEAI